MKKPKDLVFEKGAEEFAKAYTEVLNPLVKKWGVVPIAVPYIDDTGCTKADIRMGDIWSKK